MEMKMNDIDNKTKIWEFASRTDPSGTKTSKQEGRKVTSIYGTYMAKKATELFGPIGIGWGYEIEEDRYDSAGPIFDQETKEILCNAMNHTIKLKLWYIDGDKRGEVSHYGHTKYIYRSKYGFSVDDEAPKKSLTDAMKKCLSMLGFSADIFLGQFEDDDYVALQIDREKLEKADNKIEEKARQEEEQRIWLENTLKLMDDSISMSMLEGLYKTAMRKAIARNNEEAKMAINKAKDQKKKELEEKQ